MLQSEKRNDRKIKEIQISIIDLHEEEKTHI